jgi:hypothetical protein
MNNEISLSPPQVLISITSSQAAVEALDIKDLVVSDCIAAVISVINDPQHRAFLSYKIFILLHNLCELLCCFFLTMINCILNLNYNFSVQVVSLYYSYISYN